MTAVCRGGAAVTALPPSHSAHKAERVSSIDTTRDPLPLAPFHSEPIYICPTVPSDAQKTVGRGRRSRTQRGAAAVQRGMAFLSAIPLRCMRARLLGCTAVR